MSKLDDELDMMNLQEQKGFLYKRLTKVEARYERLKRRYDEMRVVFLYPRRFYPEEIRDFKRNLKQERSR